MASVELNADSGIACENSSSHRDGAYVCNVHNILGSGIKRTRLAMGAINPYDQPIGDLVEELRGRVRDSYKFLEGKELPLKSFVGLSILRVCVRTNHSDGRQQAPRAERVASIAFAKSPDDVVEIALHNLAQRRAITEAGLGSARRVGGAGLAEVSVLLHLPITQDERDYPLQFAIPTLAAQGMARDPHVALHTLPKGEGFIERIVTPDELRSS